MFASKYQRARQLLFSRLSDKSLSRRGKATQLQPVQFVGQGTVIFGDGVLIGVRASPYFYDGSCYLEARHQGAQIIFGNNISINNNLKIICERTSVSIQDDVLIGYSVTIIDSDFHNLDPRLRSENSHVCRDVVIGKNVFIGSQSSILKGVTIDENSVVAYGSVVTKSFGPNLIIGGNPAKVIGELS